MKILFMRTPLKKTTKRPAVRSLKIHTKYNINRWSERTVPMIRITGVWLDKLGFAPEQRVSITTMDKLLIIRLEE